MMPDLQHLTTRRDELHRRIADAERYLELCADITSTEEQQRTAFDILEFKEELEGLTREIERLTPG